jgi:hypothetical protein
MEQVKKIYSEPEIDLIRLDSEISLQLDSGPHGPGEGQNLIVPDYFNSDPYKANMG